MAQENFYKVAVYQTQTFIIKAKTLEEAIEQAKDKAAWRDFSMPDAYEVEMSETCQLESDKVETHYSSRHHEEYYTLKNN